MYTEMLIGKPEGECNKYRNIWEDINALVLNLCMCVCVIHSCHLNYGLLHITTVFNSNTKGLVWI
jgi:hypothetical protein